MFQTVVFFLSASKLRDSSLLEWRPCRSHDCCQKKLKHFSDKQVKYFFFLTSNCFNLQCLWIVEFWSHKKLSCNFLLSIQITGIHSNQRLTVATTIFKHSKLNLGVKHYLPGSTSARRLSRVRDALSSWLNILSIITISAEGFIRWRKRKNIDSLVTLQRRNFFYYIFVKNIHSSTILTLNQPLLKLNHEILLTLY